MIEMPQATQRPEHLVEEEVDSFLRVGDVVSAAQALNFAPDSENPLAFSHTGLKAVSLPLYELAYHQPTEARIDAANDTYGLLAGMIEGELEKLSNARFGQKGTYLGRLGELTIFSLFLRDGFNHDPAAVPVPATRYDDKHRKIDFFLSPVGTGRIDDGWAFQVKLSEWKANEHRRSSPVPAVSVEQLDKRFYRRPENANSLPRRLLRELEGTSTDADLQHLTFATSTLYETVLGTKRVRNAHRRNWELGRMAKRLFQNPLPDFQGNLQPGQA